MISLNSFTFLTAEDNMRCDAFSIFMDMIDTIDLKQKEKCIGTWFYARHGILKGRAYLQYTFDVIDEETGEIGEQVLNCRIDMNKVMVSNGWYPKIIQQAFLKYKA